MADEIDKHEEFWFEDGDLILLARAAILLFSLG